MDAELDKALLSVINGISQYFGPRAVLNGGMALRLQGIERSTMDADYAFQPSKSKREFSQELINLMNRLCDGPVTHAADSKKLKIDGTLQGVAIIVEANASDGFEPQHISTTRLAGRYDLQPSIISIMPNPMAFSNKLGAWFDRRLARDLYDIYMFSSILRVKPDPGILLERILAPSFTRAINPKPKLQTIAAFLAFLQAECDQLEPQEIEGQLRAIVSPEDLHGLGQEILVAVRRLKF